MKTTTLFQNGQSQAVELPNYTARGHKFEFWRAVWFLLEEEQIYIK